VDANDQAALRLRVEMLLAEIGPLLQRRAPRAYAQAAAIVASVVHNELRDVSPDAVRLYADAVASRHGAPGTAPLLPSHAVGKYPFSRPTALLRDSLPMIDAMLGRRPDRRRTALPPAGGAAA